MNKSKEQKRQEKLLKRLMKKSFNRGIPKPVESLLSKSRVRYDDDYPEGWKEYGFIPFHTTEDWSDDEIEEYLDECVKMPYINSPYDCTGQAFTFGIEWHRNPSGLVSFIHRVGLDV